MKTKTGEFTSKFGPSLPLGAIVKIDGKDYEVISTESVDGDQVLRLDPVSVPKKRKRKAKIP